eukprot:m.23397 g.23397  ORF g.23397 m.23397 type:complete len:439 (+) comp28461_c0_seq3:907-2223(+)
MAANDEDKPFACTFAGCTQRFSNADHLSVHENKHQLSSLQFPGREILLADQTPTPTRFLQLGEDHGLFDALKSDEAPKQPNPFERAFQETSKATTPVQPAPPPLRVTNPVKNETKRKPLMVPDHQTIKVLETSADLATVIVSGTVKTSTASSSSSLVEPLQTVTELPGQQKVFVPVAPSRALSNPSISVPVAPPPTNLAASALTLVNSTTALNGATTSAKQKLKQNIVSHNPSLLDQAMAKSKIGSVEQADVDSNGSKLPSKKRSRVRSEDVDPDQKRTKFLERNRAAATRCREKRKTWITGLEKKAQDVTSQNHQLTQEISFLRNEVAQLKSLLLAHKDCPVTLQLQQQRMRLQMQVNSATTTASSAANSTLFLLASNLPQSTSVTGNPIVVNSTEPAVASTTASSFPSIALQGLALKPGTNFVLQQQRGNVQQKQQ